MIDFKSFGDDLKRVGDQLIKAYSEELEAASKAIDPVITQWQQEAVIKAKSRLNKPNWELSKRIAGKTKTYKNGRYKFGIAGVSSSGKGKRNWNDPAQYAIFYDKYTSKKDPRNRQTHFLDKSNMGYNEAKKKIEDILQQVAQNVARKVGR